jgi:hypothetical protein
MQIYLRLILCLMILFTLFAHPSPVFACSCSMPGPPAVELGQAAAVFQGKVLSMVDLQNPLASLLNRVRSWMGLAPDTSLYLQGYGYRVTFAVSSSWKGVTTTVVQVTTGYATGDCGYPFQVGTDYMIYAHGHPSDLSVNMCSRTAGLSGATEDLSYLNTLPTLPLTMALPTFRLPVGTIVLIVVALMAISIVWFLRQSGAKD